MIGADNFLPNMGTDDFLSCLSRAALEGSCKDTSVLPRQKVKDTRAALVEHFREGRFVHPAALFAPDKAALLSWLTKNAVAAEDDGGRTTRSTGPVDGRRMTDDGEASVDEASARRRNSRRVFRFISDRHPAAGLTGGGFVSTP